MYLNKNVYKNGSLYLRYKDEIKEVLFDKKNYNKLLKFHWRTSKKKDKFYVCTGQYKNGKKIIYMHNLLMNHIPNKEYEVDHINGNSLDNRLNNLRLIKRIKNIQNASVRVDNNSTNIRGVSLDKRCGRYTVDFYFNNKRFYFKNFDKLQQAVYLRYLCETHFLNKYRHFSNDYIIDKIINKLTDEEKLAIEYYFKNKIKGG